MPPYGQKNVRDFIMEENKREISLQRAKQLHEEIADFLQFKNEYLMDMSMRRDVMSLQHKKDLMAYFGASEDDWMTYR